MRCLYQVESLSIKILLVLQRFSCFPSFRRFSSKSNSSPRLRGATGFWCFLRVSVVGFGCGSVTLWLFWFSCIFRRDKLFPFAYAHKNLCCVVAAGGHSCL